MKNSRTSKVPFISAAIAGVVAWLIHPSLFDYVVSPISQTFVDRAPSEILLYRLKTTAAFTVLGASIPFAAILVSRNKKEGNYSRSLCLLTSLALLLSLLITWLMRLDLVSVSELISELQSKDPTIPTVASHSLIPLHRIALYPVYLMVFIVIVSFVRQCMLKARIRQEGQQAAPRNR